MTASDTPRSRKRTGPRRTEHPRTRFYSSNAPSSAPTRCDTMSSWASASASLRSSPRPGSRTAPMRPGSAARRGAGRTRSRPRSRPRGRAGSPRRCPGPHRAPAVGARRPANRLPPRPRNYPDQLPKRRERQGRAHDERRRDARRPPPRGAGGRYDDVGELPLRADVGGGVGSRRFNSATTSLGEYPRSNTSRSSFQRCRRISVGLQEHGDVDRVARSELSASGRSPSTITISPGSTVSSGRTYRCGGRRLASSPACRQPVAAGAPPSGPSGWPQD